MNSKKTFKLISSVITGDADIKRAPKFLVVVLGDIDTSLTSSLG